MAYDKDDLIKKSLKAIKKHDLIYIEEIVSFLPCSKQTFYTHELDEVDAIKEAMEKGKVKKKSTMRKNWIVSDNATLQISAYKLLSTDDELARLNRQDIKHSGGVDVKQITGIEVK